MDFTRYNKYGRGRQKVQLKLMTNAQDYVNYISSTVLALTWLRTKHCLIKQINLEVRCRHHILKVRVWHFILISSWILCLIWKYRWLAKLSIKTRNGGNTEPESVGRCEYIITIMIWYNIVFIDNYKMFAKITNFAEVQFRQYSIQGPATEMRQCHIPY